MRRSGVSGSWFALSVAAALVVCLAVGATADENERTLRIGTAATSATYFPVGGLIAGIISNPPGSLDCDSGGSCGVPGLIATAVSTQGSVDNVLKVADGELDMALTQADIAMDAYQGRPPFAAEAPLSDIRAIANLFPEAVHLVVRHGSNIASVADLAGKRVSLGEEKSGTIVLARQVLNAFAIAEDDVKPAYLKLGPALDALLAGELDALFIVGGYPISGIVHAAEDGQIDLVHIKGPHADALREKLAHIGTDVISEGTYPGIGGIVTLKVGALLIASAKLDDDLVYDVTKALWNEKNRMILDAGDPNGRRIQLHMALDNLPIPLHPGAARFYREVGLLPPLPEEQAPAPEEGVQPPPQDAESSPPEQEEQPEPEAGVSPPPQEAVDRESVD